MDLQRATSAAKELEAALELAPGSMSRVVVHGAVGPGHPDGAALIVGTVDISRCGAITVSHSLKMHDAGTPVRDRFGQQWTVSKVVREAREREADQTRRDAELSERMLSQLGEAVRILGEIQKNVGRG